MANVSAAGCLSVSRIVFRVHVIQAERPHSGHLRDVIARLRPVEMRGITWQNDYRAGWKRLQLIGIELIAQANVEDARDDGVDPVLGMPVRHQLHTVRHVNPDGVRAFVRRFTYDDGEAHGRWERRKGLPVNVLGQDALEPLVLADVNERSWPLKPPCQLSRRFYACCSKLDSSSNILMNRRLKMVGIDIGPLKSET